MNGLTFQQVMRGPYVSGTGYIGWQEDYAQTFIEDFKSQLPQVTKPSLKKNTRSYTLTWEAEKKQYKALFSFEEDSFGGPCYRGGDIVVLSIQVSTKDASAKPEEKKDAKADKKPAKDKVSWKNVEDSEVYIQSHVLPLFYFLVLQSPPAGVVFV